jgi:hypothetical protein
MAVKLFNCLSCHDVLKMRRRVLRKCKCGKSSAQLDADGNILRSGPVRVLTLKFSINP